MTELQANKIGTLTMGHPVLLSLVHSVIYGPRFCPGKIDNIAEMIINPKFNIGKSFPK